jgi:flagellar motor switch protein FliM
MMPELNGVELVQILRTQKDYERLPILMVSTKNERVNVAEAFLAGVTDYLLKPFRQGDFDNKVKQLIGRPHPLDRSYKGQIDKLPDKLGQWEINLIKKHAARPIITYDFRHPQRVSKDQQRTLENLHSNYARMLASSFSNIQHSVVDCDIAFVDQTTYAEFIMSLSNPSCSYTYTIEPLGGPAILDYSLPVAYSFIDRQMGGTGGNPPSKARPLTSIERTVMGKVVTRSLADLEATWEALLKIQVSDAELETNPEFMQVAAPSDTVVLIAFEVNSQHASGLVNLCYPYFTLEPVMAYLNVQTWASRDRRKRTDTGPADRLAALDRLYTPVQAILAGGDVRLNDLVDLDVGDVLVLDAPIDKPTTVFVGERPKFLGRPTKVGNKNAVQLTEYIVKADEANHMNNVQKTETGQL